MAFCSAVTTVLFLCYLSCVLHISSSIRLSASLPPFLFVLGTPLAALSKHTPTTTKCSLTLHSLTVLGLLSIGRKMNFIRRMLSCRRQLMTCRRNMTNCEQNMTSAHRAKLLIRTPPITASQNVPNVSC